MSSKSHETEFLNAVKKVVAKQDLLTDSELFKVHRTAYLTITLHTTRKLRSIHSTGVAINSYKGANLPDGWLSGEIGCRN